MWKNKHLLITLQFFFNIHCRHFSFSHFLTIFSESDPIIFQHTAWGQLLQVAKLNINNVSAVNNYPLATNFHWDHTASTTLTSYRTKKEITLVQHTVVHFMAVPQQGIYASHFEVTNNFWHCQINLFLCYY